MESGGVEQKGQKERGEGIVKGANRCAFLSSSPFLGLPTEIKVITTQTNFTKW